MWYQFEFEYTARIASYDTPNRYADIIENEMSEEDQSPQAEFDRLYANFILAPDKRLPYTGSIPLPDGYPDVLIPDIGQMITRTDPREGAFTIGYSSAFPFYDPDRRTV
jgi:hypothetical protein